MKSRVSRSYKEIEGQKLCWCRVHKEYLSCDEFRLAIKKKHLLYCNTCLDKILLVPKIQPDYTPDDETIQHSNILLRMMGYEPNSDTTIYEQFLNRHFYDRI